MQIAKDVKRARNAAKRALLGRKAWFSVRELIAKRGPLPKHTFRVGVYFADSDVNIYQMRQWYEPLRELSKVHPVLLIARHPAGAKTLMEESGLEVAFVQKVADIEKLLKRQPLEVILYVNQNTRNFQMMRYGSRWHVFINHGESDKMYMTSNQYKTYDYAFIAGNAAKQRLAKTLWNYDLDRRTFAIGRPQADHLSGEPPFTPDERMVVLYAPTWEGDRPAASYGSVLSHGETLVRELIATGRHRVVYRPHPRSGVVDFDFGGASERIIRMLEDANRKDPAAQHVYDTSPSLGWQLSAPDVAICDISAMVYDRLATGKPLMVTRPQVSAAEVDEGGYLGVCEWLHADDTGKIVRVLDRVVGDESAKKRLATWSAHYFGDTTPGSPTERFHEAIGSLLASARERLDGRVE